MGNRPRNRKMSAKEFFKDINEEKSDNTRVSAPNTKKSVVPSQEALDGDWRNTHPAVQETRRLQDAEAEGHMDDQGSYHGGEMNWDKAKDKYNTKADDYYWMGSQAYFGDKFGKEPQKKIDNADDMAVYTKGMEYRRDPHNLQKMQDYAKAKETKKEHSVERGKQFERNLHQYDNAGGKGKFTKKYSDVEPPESIRRPKKSFAKSFFEGVE